jgi:hypothetical protein
VAVSGDGAAAVGDQPGVVDQNIDPGIPRLQFGRQATSLIQVGEIRDVVRRPGPVATARALAGDLPTTTTLSPRRARARAAAAPIPSLAPVTTTTRRSSDAVLMRQP